MKIVIIGLVVGGMLTACLSAGQPVEYAKACDGGNDGRTIETSGYLDVGFGLYCSNRAGRSECGFQLKNDLRDKTAFTADIAVGSGANTMDKAGRQFEKAKLIVRGHDGNKIDFSRKVKVTGKLSVSSG